MNYIIDKRAVTQWGKSAISFKNYQTYIRLKEERFKLGLIDLLYISNFKGGNATINEPEITISDKLVKYSDIMMKINETFLGATISELSDDEIEALVERVNDICNLTLPGSYHKIDGFSVSYLSALLNAYFPYLIPILDRRLLINLSLVTDVDIDKQGQIKRLVKFYRPLIYKIRELSISTGNNIRDLDRDIFSRKISI